MKKGLSELVFVIDKSGSMFSLASDTIGGFNALLKKQKEEDGEAFVTTILFDSSYTVFQEHLSISHARFMTEIDYIPGGSTAMLDAVGYAIDSVGKRLSETAEEERPENVVVTIITDGKENSSMYYTREMVKERIKHQQEKYSWKFVFLGANIDAEFEADELGIPKMFSKNYTNSKAGLQSAYEGMSKAMSVARKRGSYKSVEEFEMAVCDSLGEVK